MKRAAILAIAVLALLTAACNPLEDDATPGEANPTGTAENEPAGTLPLMQIVTRTPVDPGAIPTEQAETPENVEVPSTYVVQDGDSLYSIAAKFRLELAEIVELNGLSDPNDISVGQELRLPSPPE